MSFAVTIAFLSSWALVVTSQIRSGGGSAFSRGGCMLAGLGTSNSWPSSRCMNGGERGLGGMRAHFFKGFRDLLHIRCIGRHDE